MVEFFGRWSYLSIWRDCYNENEQQCGGECRLLPNNRIICVILIDVVFQNINNTLILISL